MRVPVHEFVDYYVILIPTFSAMPFLIILLQSTPVISRLLGAKIRERELSGSPVISRCRAKATTREFRITDPHSQAFTTLKQYVER